jgi:PAS domain S-box-containing protein
VTEDVEVLRRALERERTARKEAERLLREKAGELYNARILEQKSRRIAEQEALRYRSLSEALPDVLFTVKVDGAVTFAQERSGAEGIDFSDHVSFELREASLRAVATGEPQRLDYVAGRSRRFEARISKLNEVEAIVISRDVTLERQVEAGLLARVDAAVTERERLERALFDTLTAFDSGFWERDLASGTTVWSDGMYGLFGYEKGTVDPGLEAFGARLHPDDYAQMMAAPLQNRAIHEYRVLLPSGGIRWCRDTVLLVFDADGRPIRMRGIVADITRERETARQLSRLAEVASRTENAVVISDLQGRIEWVNEAFTRLTGWSLAEVQGRSPGTFLQGPHTDPETRARIREALRQGLPFEAEILNYTKDGRQYWVHIETRVSLDTLGRPTGFIAVESDITARRVAERKDSVAERVAALLLTSDSLETASRRLVDELVSELDVRVAQFWVVDSGRPDLVYVAGAADQASSAAGQEFLAATRALEFREGLVRVVGVGIPGVAWGTKQPFVLQEFSTATLHDQLSRRQSAALAADIHTVCAAPILGPDGVLGVLEIGGTRYYPGHELLPSLLQRVAEQLAAFMLHDQSRKAFRAVFDQSPDALLLVGVQGAIAAANARAKELFAPGDEADVEGLIEGGASLLQQSLSSHSSESSGTAALVHLPAKGARGPFPAEVSVSVTPSSITQAAIFAIRDLTERQRMEAALTRSLREKETLLREVHHRVKNNLQIVASLLGLQSEHVVEPGARMALDETVYRVRAMALVHEQLYATRDLARVGLADYARSLSTSLQHSLGPDAEFQLSAEEVEIPIDLAVPIGLVLNELLTNALKHGRSEDGRCRVAIELVGGAETFSLRVRDRGRGFPARPPSESSLGMQLIHALSRQIRAELRMTTDGGAHTELVVPIRATPLHQVPS